MHRSSIQLYLDEQAPDSLVNFLHGRGAPSSKTSDSGVEPPTKRRKANKGTSADVPLPSDYEDDYLTLVRIDISITSHRSPRQSYPSPSSDDRSDKDEGEHNTLAHPQHSDASESDRGKREHTVILQEFSQNIAGEYRCRIATVAGDVLFDNAVRCIISPQTLKILQKAVNPARRSQTKSTFIISKSLVSHYDADTLGFGQDADIQTFDLCVRVLIPNARDLSGSMGITQNDWLDICAPEWVEATNIWSPRDFYDNVHVPKSEKIEIQDIDELQCTLYPFQKRALQWLLRREGVVDGKEDKPAELPHGFVSTSDADGRQCLVSRFLGLVTTDEKVPLNIGSDLRGGVLCEEMGLGKTVEIIALICAHKRDQIPNQISPHQLPQSPATLIITPPAILQQWKTELQTLAPGLKVLVYEGLRVEAGRGNHAELLLCCMQHDVVLTTYNVLAKEIHYAETPERNLRHEKRYEKRLSPLTQTVWWRVVLDEAQMVESGVSNAARVAKLIPREIAWCVSGTPVKRDARDLFGLLDFLRYEPYCNSSPHTWDRLVKHHKSVFAQIFRTLALRHTKDHIKDDLQLPPQKRVIITVPFTQIEEQNYSALFKEMSDDCGLDLDGAPLAESWDPESPAMIEKMRNWLTRLRQTCLHPEVGHRNRRALGNSRGPLRTVGEVLEVMIEQNDTATRSEERLLLLSQIRRGQILEHAGLSEEALQIWLQTLEEAKLIVQDCRDQLQAEIDSLGLAEGVSRGEGDDTEAATAIRTGLHRQRLRAAVEIEHVCTFFVASAYFQIKTDGTRTMAESHEFYELERKEALNYERAKTLRKELLSEARKKADAVTSKIDDKATHRSLVKIPKILPLKQHGGIESRRHFERIESLIAIMQRQATQLEELREKTVKLLLLPLVDEESADLQGDEYETSTKEQDEVYVYVQILRALIADRHSIITGQKNFRIQEEMKAALILAKEGQGHSPQLLQQLLSTRSQLGPPEDLGSIRALITEIRELKTALRQSTERGNSRAAAELLIVNGAVTKLNQVSTEQTRAVSGLERELEQLRDAMNLRLEYYKQLQAISDTVAPYEVELTNEARIAILLTKEADESRSKARLDMMKGRGRYFVHLRDQQTDTESQKMCIICQSSFEVGTLTSCGHSYCVDCIRFWWNSHRTCPTCKKHLSRNDFHRITYKPQELIMEEEAQPQKKVMSFLKDSETSTIYSGIRDTTLNQINNIDLDGSFGTKIDTLARHVLWIRQHDPGAKAIVFSQYREFLEVLSRAFSHFKIGWTGIDRKDGIQKFKNDASVECFFLHAKAHSSGLNLVNATHVFLCEPLINTAIELQAIARVHRIGQHQTTTVWMYLVEDTVEKSIYDISVSRRLVHMGHSDVIDSSSDEKNLESKIEAANTLELEQTPFANLLTKGSSGGEMVGKDDLWNCLFRQKSGQMGRLSRETERLVGRQLGAAAAEARLEFGSDSTSAP